jgi:hypothetical protein
VPIQDYLYVLQLLHLVCCHRLGVMIKTLYMNGTHSCLIPEVSWMLHYFQWHSFHLLRHNEHIYAALSLQLMVAVSMNSLYV